MIKRTLFALLATAVVVGCTKNEDSEGYNSSNNTANFSSLSIDTRTNDAGTEWEAGDKIGIFSDGFDSDYANVAYEALSSADKTTFSLVEDEDPILYPNVAESAGMSVDFYAYYPHSVTVGSEGLTTIDIADQEDLGAIDLMTASSMGNEYYLGKEYSDVEFEFKHNLSQLVLKISVNEEIKTLKGLTAKITDIETQGTYYTCGENQGTLESSSITVVKDVDLTVSVADTDATTTITAILHPGTYSSNTSRLIFTLDETDKEYSVDFATTLTASNAHTFNIALGNDITGFKDGSAITTWGNGGSETLYTTPSDIVFNGTSYEIYTAAGLKAFADLVNGDDNTTAITSGDGFGSFGSANATIDGTIMNDIDLSNICGSGIGDQGADIHWTPIGDYSSNTIVYSGDFDGGGYNVRGLYINQDGNNYKGLFGYVDGATISNIGLVGGSVAGYGFIGGIAGYANNSSFSDCYNTGDVTGRVGSYTGGIAGYAEDSSVSDCYNTGDVTGSNIYVGGITGYAKNSSVSDCYNTGDVTGSSNYVGGIAGYVCATDANSTYSITKCYNTGNVTGSSACVGGVVGSAVYAPISDCYNTGDVEGSGNHVGGVVGDTSSTVSNCYNTGDVEGSGINVGGVVGDTSSTVSNCYNTGDVTGSNNYVGGIAGYAEGSKITECYNTGNVTSSGNSVGGIAGYANSYSSITSCYNTGDVTGSSSSSNYVGGIAGRIIGDDGTNSTSSITECYNTGNVTSSGNSVGGIAGSAQSYSSITSCYNTGDVTGSTDRNNIGGIVGETSSNTTFTSCYSCGAVSGSVYYTGGVVGKNDAPICYCYYDTETVGTTNAPTTAVGGNGSGTPDSNYVTTGYAGLSTTEMKDSDILLTYLNNGAEAGGATITTWSAGTNGYPILAWQVSGN